MDVSDQRDTIYEGFEDMAEFLSSKGLSAEVKKEKLPNMSQAIGEGPVLYVKSDEMQIRLYWNGLGVYHTEFSPIPYKLFGKHPPGEVTAYIEIGHNKISVSSSSISIGDNDDVYSARDLADIGISLYEVINGSNAVKPDTVKKAFEDTKQKLLEIAQDENVFLMIGYDNDRKDALLNFDGGREYLEITNSFESIVALLRASYPRDSILLDMILEVVGE